MFLDGQIQELWKQASAASPSNSRQKKASNTLSQTSFNVRLTLQLVQEGQYSKAAKALTSHDLDFNGAEAMRDKHPQSPAPTIPVGPTPEAFSISREQAATALASFHSGTAAGPSSLHAAHFKDVVAAPAAARSASCLDTMTDVLNILAKGNIPPEVSPFLCGANLFAANKKTGGHCPIAVGETLRRWVSKCLASQATAECATYLAPH
jgi:hypothetical protein